MRHSRYSAALTHSWGWAILLLLLLALASCGGKGSSVTSFADGQAVNSSAVLPSANSDGIDMQAGPLLQGRGTPLTQEIANANLARMVSVADGHEDDDNAGQAQAIVLSPGYAQQYADSHSIFPPGDEDWLSFDGTAGMLLVLFSDTTFYSNQTDTAVTLYDSTLTELASDDNSGVDPNDTNNYDFFLAYTIQDTGTYYVKVTGVAGSNDLYDLNAYGFEDSMEDDDTSGTARPISMSLTAQYEDRALTSADEEWYSFVVNSDDPTNFNFMGAHQYVTNGDLNIEIYDSSMTLLDGSSNTISFNENFTSNAAGTYYVKLTGDQGELRFTWKLLSTGADLYEDDDNKTEAREITPNNTGTIESHTFHPNDTDEDWVKFSATPGNVVMLTGSGSATTQAAIYDALDTELATSTSDGGANHFRLDFDAPAAGTYYVKVDADTGMSGTYSLKYVSGFNAPASVAASDGDQPAKIRITWAEVPGADRYYVYRATAENGTYTQVGSPTTALFFDNFIANRTTYWFKVRGYNDALASFTAYSAPNSGFTGIAAPGNVAASDGTYNDKIRISWSSVNSVTGYKIWRATSQNGTYAQVGTTASGTLLLDNVVTNTNKYWYKVQAYDATGDGIMSTPNDGFKAMLAVTNVAATDGSFSDKVRVSWTHVAGATSYKIFRATSANGTYSQIGTDTATPYDDVPSNTATYHYKIKPVNGNGDGPLSTSDSGYKKIGTPANVAASDGTFTDKIRITWGAVTSATSYRVYRATSEGGTYSLLASGLTTTTFDDTINNYSLLWYKVQAVDANGVGLLSTANSGYRNMLAPGSAVASDGTFGDKVRITWNAVTGATGYKVFRSTTSTGTFTEIGTTTSELLFDDAVGNFSIYWYKVAATNSNGQGLLSAANSGFKGIPAPENVAASDNTFPNFIRITWNAVPGASGYKVYRSTTLDGTYSLVGTTNTTQFDNFIGVTFTGFYKVRSTNANGDGPFSAADQGSRP